MREVILLAGGIGFMAVFLTPAAQTTELDQSGTQTTLATAAKPAGDVVLNEDSYWEYANNDSDKIVFGEPMVDADAGAADHGKTITKKSPKNAAGAKGKSDWNQEFPKPLD